MMFISDGHPVALKDILGWMILSGEDMADITSQEGIVDLQKFIFDAQYVLYLQYSIFYLTTIY